VRQETFPQRDASGQGQHVAKSLRQADVVQGLLQRADQMFGVAQEAFSRRRQFGAVASAMEQARAQRGFQGMNTRADG